MGIDLVDADHPAVVKAAVRAALPAGSPARRPPAEADPPRRVLRYAHRGAWSRQPAGPRENTLAAFAAAAGAWDGVELDVHRTADGHLPVIGDMTWDELRAAAPWVPELCAALRLCRDAGLRVNVEIKAGGDFYPGIEAQVLAAIRRHGWAEATIVSSFDQRALLRVRELDARVPTAVLYTGRVLDPVGLARRCGACGVHPEQQLLRPEDVAAMRAAGLWVAAWTARGPAAFARLAAMGVDAVIGDPE
jgi:glycerophosphoryl diester phosphodiesterase